jgi:hypothetical protein
MTEDKIARAYARLASLKDNLPEWQVSETYVTEYHQVLKHLEDSGFDIEEFKIPGSMVKRVQTGGNYLTGKVDYSDDKFVERAYIKTKLDSVLGYFELKMRQQKSQEPQREIGFRGPRKE